MHKSKCPHCGIKLGNYLYADACPSCGRALEYNAKPLTSAPIKGPMKEPSWLARAFFRVVRMVES